MKIAVITIEGVLAENPDLMTSPPTKLGRDFYNALKGGYRIILISNGSDIEKARFWLRKEGVQGWAMVMCYPDNSAMSMSEWKVNAVRGMLGDGWDVAMVIDCDLHLHRAMLEEGVASVLVSYPTARPGWLPETPGPLRPWDEIAATVEEQNLLEQGGLRRVR